MNSLPLQKMLDYHPVIYCIIDRNHCFSYINQTTSDILGFQPKELIGKPFLDFVVEQDREKTADTLRQLHRGKFIKSFENRYYDKHGSFITIQWSSQWNMEDQLLYSLGHAIVHRGQVEQLQHEFSIKLKKTSSKLSETFDRITDGFFTLDEQWRFIYVNKAAEQILKIPREELLASVLWEVFPKVMGSNTERELKRSRELQTSVRFEAYYAHPLNKWFEVDAYPSNGGTSVIFKDITERKNVEVEMRKLSLVVKHTDNVVVMCNSDGTTKWVNDAFVKKTGYSLDEVCGRRIGDLLAGPETDNQTIQRLRTKYKKGESFSEEILVYTKSKEKLWLYVTGQIIHDAEGNVEELISIQTDITEKKQLELQLNREREAYQRWTTAAAIQAQEQERSVIGRELHDNVNQLLTTVKLYLEVILGSENNKEELTKKSIHLLQDAISEIRHLSKQLSAPTIGNITLAESIKELCAIVAVTKQFKVSVDTSGIDDLEVDEELHLAIYRILQEHFTNILKHAKAKNVYVNLDFDQGAISLLIIDDGKGFDTHQKRSGIGITNMVTRAQSVNGTLSVVSEKGKGCLLTAQFPLAL